MAGRTLDEVAAHADRGETRSRVRPETWPPDDRPYLSRDHVAVGARARKRARRVSPVPRHPAARARVPRLARSAAIGLGRQGSPRPGLNPDVPARGEVAVVDLRRRAIESEQL